MRGFTIASVIVLVVVVAVVGIAAILLARTVQEAQTINDKAQNIATTGRGINVATDSVVQLNRTNKLAESILKSARPLDDQLGGIVVTAQGIDGLAGSINSTAGSINSKARSINGSAASINDSAGSINTAAGAINSTAGSINSSAGRINSSAGSINSSAGRINASAGNINGSAGRIDRTARSILGTARQIDDDVRLINTNLNVTLSLVTAVKGDTGNILGQAGGANDTAACIDAKVMGQAGGDGDCRGQATPTAAQQRSEARGVAPPELRSPEDLRDFLREGAAPPPGDQTPAAPSPPAGDPVPTPDLPLPRDPLKDILEGLPGIGPLPKLPPLPPLPDLGQGQGQGGAPGNPLPPDLLDRLIPGLGQR